MVGRSPAPTLGTKLQQKALMTETFKTTAFGFIRKPFTNIAVSPNDGGLWICSFYKPVIFPPSILHTLNVPSAFRPSYPVPNITKPPTTATAP